MNPRLPRPYPGPSLPVILSWMLAGGGIGLAQDLATATNVVGTITMTATPPSTNNAAASDPIMTGSVLQTPAQLGGDENDPSGQRRRSLRSSMTNLPPATVSNRGGAVRFVTTQRTAKSFFQLFNPFAPSTAGSGTVTAFEWHPGQGAAPLPRAFRDERFHEAEGIQLIGTPR